MGSLDTFDPASGPALPDLPPLSIRELAVGLVDLFSKADGLALPRYVSMFGPSLEAFSLQFAPVAASYTALTAWAQRFGAALASDDHTSEDGQPCKYVHISFDFFAVEVEAYAFIPVTET